MADEQPPMATLTPPHVPVSGNLEALDRSARAERRRQRLELEEIVTGGLGATREEGAAREDDFVLVGEPPPRLEEVGPSNPLEASPPSDPQEGSEMDRLVQRDWRTYKPTEMSPQLDSLLLRNGCVSLSSEPSSLKGKATSSARSTTATRAPDLRVENTAHHLSRQETCD